MTRQPSDGPAAPDLGRVLIILPAHNEAEGIARTLASLKRLSFPYEALVVDDGSTDATGDLARRCGARVLEMCVNLGVGGAMQAGYQYADARGFDVAIQFDADGQHRAGEIPKLLEPLGAGEADLVVGSRLLDGVKYRFSLERFLGSRLLAGLVSLLVRRRITDPTSGFRAVSRRGIRFFSRHYPQTWLGDTVEALVEAARHGLRVVEVPVKMKQRSAGRSAAGRVAGVIHTLRVILAVLIDSLEGKFEDVDAPPPTESKQGDA